MPSGPLRGVALCCPVLLGPYWLPISEASPNPWTTVALVWSIGGSGIWNSLPTNQSLPSSYHLCSYLCTIIQAKRQLLRTVDRCPANPCTPHYISQTLTQSGIDTSPPVSTEPTHARRSVAGEPQDWCQHLTLSSASRLTHSRRRNSTGPESRVQQPCCSTRTRLKNDRCALVKAIAPQILQRSQQPWAIPMRNLWSSQMKVRYIALGRNRGAGEAMTALQHIPKRRHMVRTLYNRRD